jgi:hypothetical protein
VSTQVLTPQETVLIPETGQNSASKSWTWLEKAGLRASIIFFALSLFSLFDWKFWRELVHANWLHFQDTFRLTAFVPSYLSAPKWGFASFASQYAILAVAVAGTFAWGYLERGAEDYAVRYYWLRVFLRYRLSIGLIAYGMLQLFPILFPKPTLSDLYTNYGDYLQWKLYYLTNGVAHAHYEQFLGGLMVVAGVLLLSRATETIGALIAASLLFNISLANIAYQLGDHLYAVLLLLAASFLLLNDADRLLNLLVLQRPAKADHFKPDFSSPRARRIHLVGKFAVVLFLLFYTGTVAYGFSRTNWPFPDTSGTLPNSEGYYNVREFQWDGNVVPYSLTDPRRWQNVVFEKWNTISIRSSRPIPIEVANPSVIYASDQRKYEFAGNGGRRFYSYATNTATQTIQLQGKNDPKERISLRYSYAADGALVLEGTDASGNSLRAVLDKVDKQFLLLLGRRKPVTTY